MLAVVSFPLLDSFLTVLWVFLFAFWIWTLISVLLDVFRSTDLSGWAKAGWFLFIAVLPLVGVLVYLVVRGGAMASRTARRYETVQQAYRDWLTTTPIQTPTLIADELEKLVNLRDRGVITGEEFARQKARLLAAESSAA